MTDAADPRRPDKVYKFNLQEYLDTIATRYTKKSKYAQYDSTPLIHAMSDYMSFISLITGATALLLRSKLAAWASVFACISAIVTNTQYSTELKQNFASASFSFMILTLNYFGAKAADEPLSSSGVS